MQAVTILAVTSRIHHQSNSQTPIQVYGGIDVNGALRLTSQEPGAPGANQRRIQAMLRAIIKDLDFIRALHYLF